MLKENKIGLTVDEAKQVEKLLGRAPTLTEAIVWGIQGSEHCSYKSSRKFLKTLPVAAPNVMLGVGEDSGIAHFAKDRKGRKYGIIMAHESHNHPSQVVPYEGAATGVGGIVRDVLCMGGRPVATADPLRFGQSDRKLTKQIAKDVIAGIGGYGNPLGVPNIAGDAYFDESFNDNCLVNVVCLGQIREDEIIHSYVPTNAEGWDIIIFGKPTDNSGMGGASFASLELDEADKEANKGAVQEPNPFLERHLVESTMNLIEKLKAGGDLDKVGLKDMGAGGNICATVELVEPAGLGAELDLSRVHTSMENLHPSVIACAETQERFAWICHPSITQTILDHYNKEWDLPHVSVGARASHVGKVKKGNYVVKFGENTLLDASATDITKGLQYDRPYKDPARKFEEPDYETPDLTEMLKKILASENVACRTPIFESYDKVVQGQTVFEPGIADAGLLAPFRNREDVPEIHKVGAALSVDANPRYGLISPYWCSVNAVVESMRNVAAIGATPWAATDCLNFGNPEKPEQMWELVEGIRGIKEALEGVGHISYPGHPLPIISGNVSLYNESKNRHARAGESGQSAPLGAEANATKGSNHSVAPSPIIGMLGRIENIDKAITMELKREGAKLYLLGKRKNELGGSEYYRQMGHLGAFVPKPDFEEVKKQLQVMLKAVDRGALLAAHDISEGGLAACLAEMTFGGRGKCKLSVRVDISRVGELSTDQKLFSQTGGFVVEVALEEEFLSACRGVGLEPILLGETTSSPEFTILENGEPILSIQKQKLLNAWLFGLRTTFTHD